MGAWLVPGPERTLMEFAYSELTQKVNLLNGRFVGERVSVGLAVDVCVVVSVRVEVEAMVTVPVGRSVCVAEACTVTDAGTRVNVGVVGGGGVGLKIKIDASISRIIIPMMIGTAYLRSAGGRNEKGSAGGVTTGGSPVYPRADSRLLKLSTYLSSDVKLT